MSSEENGGKDVLAARISELEDELDSCREEQRRMRFLLDMMPFYVAYVDKDLRYQFNNAFYADWLETGDPSELLGEEVSEVIGDEAMDEIQEHIQRALTGDRVEYEGVVRYKQGIRNVELQYIPDRVDEDVRGFGAIVENRTEQREREERLQEAAIVFEASRDAIIVLNHRHEIVRANHAFTELTGYSLKDAIGKTPWSLTAPGRKRVLDQIWRKMLEDGHWQGELWQRRKDGSIGPVWVNVNTVSDDTGHIHHYVGVMSDLGAEATLPHLAHHDALTRLPNRLLLEARLEHTLERAQRAGHLAAVLFMDLDGFKSINDDFGHAEGDTVLQAIARRLETLVRAEDTVARLGGDEFVVILEQIGGTELANEIATRISNSFRESIVVGDREHRVGASIGISLFPEHGNDREAMLAAADSAMYIAKNSGKDQVAFYDPSVHMRAGQ